MKEQANKPKGRRGGGKFAKKTPSNSKKPFTKGKKA
jgi:hypothetical protein